MNDKKKRKINHVAQGLLLPINPVLVIILGVYTLIWGVWLANPFWTVFSQAPLYDAMAQLAPEWFWGGVAITCGSFTIYGALKRHYRPLVRGAGIAFWHWLMIAVLYAAGDILNTGAITSLTFAIYSAVVFLNLRVNFKDDKDTDHPLMHNGD